MSFPCHQCLRQQTGKHLHHAPNDAVRSRPAPLGPAGENVHASCSDWREHVSGGGKGSLKQRGSLFGTERSVLTQCSSPSVAVHYLWETGMFRFTDTDKYQVTPLHLAASTGNTEVVRYLLRNQVGYSQTGLHSLTLSTPKTDAKVLLQRRCCKLAGHFHLKKNKH